MKCANAKIGGTNTVLLPTNYNPAFLSTYLPIGDDTLLYQRAGQPIKIQ